jgi:hypothetical protein
MGDFVVIIIRGLAILLAGHRASGDQIFAKGVGCLIINNRDNLTLVIVWNASN